MPKQEFTATLEVAVGGESFKRKFSADDLSVLDVVLSRAWNDIQQTLAAKHIS